MSLLKWNAQKVIDFTDSFFLNNYSSLISTAHFTGLLLK